MKEDKKVSWEDIAWSNMYSIEAPPTLKTWGWSNGEFGHSHSC